MNAAEERGIVLVKTEKAEERKGEVEVCLVEEGEKGKGEEQRMSVWEESINVQGERWFGSKLGGERKKDERVWKLIMKRCAVS